MRLPLLLSVLFLAACAGGPDSAGSLDLADGPVLPDTQTVDGVLEMRHGADAFARAPVWTLDSVPLVVIDGGEEYDLSGTFTADLLSDGRSVAARRIGGGELILFDATGRPERQLARGGQGPGELVAPGEAIVLPGDTILVVDAANSSVNRYTADSGLISTARMAEPFPAMCFGPGGRLTDGRLVAVGACSSNRRLPDGSLRAETPLVTYGLDFANGDTVALVTGSRMTMIEVEQGGRKFPAMAWMQLGQPTTVTAVDSTIVVGSGVGGYALELLRPDGRQVGRIVVERPPVLVTDSMRQAVVDRELRRIEENSEPGINLDAARRFALTQPIADTLAAYQRVTASPNGTIWVLDFMLPDDSTWTASAFRVDGAILGRVTGPRHGGMPVWFGDDRVQIRQVDGDGIVRFGVYGLANARPAPRAARAAGVKGKR